MALKNNQREGKFVSILADGKMHMSVPEGTEGAIKRDYETSDGKKGSKTELVYTELSGMIEKVEFYEGDFGKLIQLTVRDGEEEPVILSISTASNFGEDLMKKLPNIDIKKPVVFTPYSFDDDKGKKRRGISIKQDEEKIESYYYDPKKKVNVNGFPEPKFKKKNPTKDDWKLYFLNARLFLIEQISELFKLEDHDADQRDMVEQSKKAAKSKDF